MNIYNTLAVKAAHFTTFATNTGIPEVDTFRIRMLGVIATCLTCYGAWRIFQAAVEHKAIKLIGSIIVIGVAIYFVTDPTNAQAVVKALWSKLTGGSM